MSHLVGDERGPIATIGELLLGKYRVERVVGEGGMGMVLAVRHIEVGELFAMKILKPSALREWRGPERFAREARAVSRLKSEHVARVFDVGQLESGLPYMLLEHLDGCDVRTVLDREGSLSARETIDCARLALDAIREAHEEGLIHRDLKPENLFLAKRPDGDWTIKVLDFGISKDLRDQGGGSVTHTSNVMGSPFYMSPEQMRSAKHVDERTDLWAMGIIMFELLTGEVPFPGETVTQVCASVLERPLPSIATLAPSTPASLVAVIEKLFGARHRRPLSQRTLTLGGSRRGERRNRPGAPGCEAFAGQASGGPFDDPQLRGHERRGTEPRRHHHLADPASSARAKGADSRERLGSSALACSA